MVLVLPETDSYETLDLNVKNGHAYMEGTVTVDSLKLRVSQGEAGLEGLTVLEDSDIQVDGGSLSLCGDPGKSVTADCKQGHLGMSVPFEEEDCNYEVKVSGGKIHLGSHNYEGKSASHTLDNNSDRLMKLSCSHGEPSVEFD